MNTVIFKWNPSFSSYSMFHYLNDLVNCNYGVTDGFNWSVWEFDKVHEGDRYYWLKLGQGAVGIVGCGTITSEPYEDEDWSGKGRKTYYVDFKPEMLLNPDALPILTNTTLNARIPDFEWDHGHSGIVLNRVQAERLEKLWEAFVTENQEDLEKKAHCGLEENDYIYWNK